MRREEKIIRRSKRKRRQGGRATDWGRKEAWCSYLPDDGGMRVIRRRSRIEVEGGGGGGALFIFSVPVSRKN